MDSRIAELQHMLRARRIDYLFVSSEPNLRWLTGEPYLSGLLVVPTKAEPFAVTSAMDRGRLERTGIKVYTSSSRPPADIVAKNFYTAAARLIGKKVKKIGFEDTRVSVNSFEKMKVALKGRLVAGSDILKKLRAVKTAAEIISIKKALRCAEAGMTAALVALRPGARERELAAEAESAMRRAGADWYSFESIIGSGPNAGLPHQRVTDKKIAQRDLVVIDIGAMADGYCSDISRTFCLAPGGRERKIYRTVLNMRLAALNKIKNGIRTRLIDAAARAVAARAGFKKEFTHSIGHGIGIEVHEAPQLSADSKDTLKPGMIFTIEPGLYFAGWGGVRVEDMFLLTRSGLELLTKFPRKLMP